MRSILTLVALGALALPVFADPVPVPMPVPPKAPRPPRIFPRTFPRQTLPWQYGQFQRQLSFQRQFAFQQYVQPAQLQQLYVPQVQQQFFAPQADYCVPQQAQVLQAPDYCAPQAAQFLQAPYVQQQFAQPLYAQRAFAPAYGYGAAFGQRAFIPRGFSPGRLPIGRSLLRGLGLGLAFGF